MQRIGITVTGFPGSGSTTLGNIIAEKLGWPRPYYSGGVVRWLIAEMDRLGKEAALEMGPADIVAAMERGAIAPQPDLAQKYPLFPPELDRLVDLTQMEFLRGKSEGVHEGRLAWFLAKKLHEDGEALDKKFVHILCLVDHDVGARRQLERDEYRGVQKTVEEVLAEAKKRLLLERERYRELYRIENHLDPASFDVVIDTTRLSKDEVCRRALDEIRQHCPSLLAPRGEDYQT